MATETENDTVLRYVSDTEPGIRRRKRGRGFSYHLPDGRMVKDETLRARIDALAIPPAYTDVWICLDENGHLQATGIDDRGRKQYRYHSAWEAERQAYKYGQLRKFGAALPRIRRRVRRDLKAGLPREDTMLAAMVALIDKAHLRAGNRSYVEENGTFGAATLRKRHLDTDDDAAVTLRFQAKGGKVEEHELRSKILHDVLEEIADLPGRELFAWRDETGALTRIGSERLNAYIADVAGEGMTAKTFRTWAGSVAAFAAVLADRERGEAVRVKDVCDAAARELHNTAAVCKANYVHPAVLDMAGGNEGLSGALRAGLKARKVRDLSREESRFLAFLKAVEAR